MLANFQKGHFIVFHMLKTDADKWEFNIHETEGESVQLGKILG